MAKQTTKDMTTGSPMKLILQFSIPLLLGNLFQQMYNLVDTIIVGKYLGLNALSAVGATGAITFLIIGFCLGACSGLAIPVAQQFGAAKYDQMRGYVTNAMYVAGFLAIIMTIATMLGCRWILEAMGTPADIIDGSYDYLIIIFAGIPFTILYNVVSGVIRALGDSKTPFKFLVVATIINIILDLVFIIVLGFGVSGAGLATIMAQAISGVLCFIFMKKRFPILKSTKQERALDWKKVRVLAVMGLPMGLQYSITAIGSIMLQSAINGLGTVYVATYTAAGKIKQFAMCPFDGFANASATFCSQNLGAKKIDRIYKGLRSSIFASLIYAIFIGVVLIFAGGKLALIFVDASETEVLANVSFYLKCAGYFYVMLAILNNTRMTIQGLGYSGLSIWCGLTELAARGIMSLFVIPKYGFIAACFTDQSAWLSAAIVVIILFEYVMRRIKKNIGTEVQMVK